MGKITLLERCLDGRDSLENSIPKNVQNLWQQEGTVTEMFAEGEWDLKF